MPDPHDAQMPPTSALGPDGEATRTGERPPTERAKRGRPRDPSVDARVMDAVIELYAQYGWAGLTFDDVARRAKVGKAGLYLRWASKEDLLLDSMAGVRARRVPDTHHDVRTELASIARALFAFYSSTRGLAYLRLYVECRYVPGLEERWRKQQTTPMFLETRALVHDAVLRGELPEGTSPTILLDTLIGAITNHVLSTPLELFPQMQANGPAYIDGLIDFVLAGAGVPPG